MYSISTALFPRSSSAAAAIGRRRLFSETNRRRRRLLSETPFSISSSHWRYTVKSSLFRRPAFKPMASITTKAEEKQKPCLFSETPFSISSSHWRYTNKSSLFRRPAFKPMASITTKAEEKQKPWLLVGLGNPGKRYSGTRHNVGFELVDFIAEAEGIAMSTVSFKSAFGKGFIGEVPVMLAKPQTFMNASGESVGAIVSYYKIPLKQVLVMLDDMDLPFAKLRLLPKGGHGGHNGMRSIINHLKGSRDFPRLRIGIGRPPGKMDSANFVLRPFNREEREELDFTFQKGLEAVRILVQDNFDKSATFVNSAKSLGTL